MIKVLFKSEEAADSESAVVHHKKYRNLSNLTPKNGEEHIKVTTKTEVVVKTAKSSVVKTAEDATPLDALREWDII